MYKHFFFFFKYNGNLHFKIVVKMFTIFVFFYKCVTDNITEKKQEI